MQNKWIAEGSLSRLQDDNTVQGIYRIRGRFHKAGFTARPAYFKLSQI